MEDCKELSGKWKPLPGNREIESVRQKGNQTRTEAKASERVRKNDGKKKEQIFSKHVSRDMADIVDYKFKNYDTGSSSARSRVSSEKKYEQEYNRFGKAEQKRGKLPGSLIPLKSR